MAKAKKKKTFAQAIAAVRREGRGTKRGIGLRWSEARGSFYLPIKQRSPAGKKAASRYDVATCSAGSTAQMGTGPWRASQGTCGPKAMGASRSHELLGYWRGVLSGKSGSLGRFQRNPGPNLAYVYMPNPHGSGCQWGLIEPRAGKLLASGTAASPESGYKAAHKKAKGLIGGYKGRDVEMKADKEWTQVPRAGKKKKASKKKASKKPTKNARSAMRAAMRGA